MGRSYSETYKQHHDVASTAARMPTSGSAALAQGFYAIATAVGIASLRVATNGVVWVTNRLRAR